MEDEMKEKLAAFLREEHQLIADPERTLDQTIATLEFFERYLEEEEPWATSEISLMEAALNFLEAYR